MELFIFKNTPVYSFMHTVGRIVHVTPIPHTTHITFSNLRTVANISVCNILLSWEESHGKHSRASHSNGTSVVSLLQLWDSMSTQPHSALLQFPHQPRHRGQVVWRSKRETSAPLEWGRPISSTQHKHTHQHRTQLSSQVLHMTWKGFAITCPTKRTKPTLCAKLFNVSKTGTFTSPGWGFFPPFILSSPFSLHRDHLQTAMLISNSLHSVLKLKITPKNLVKRKTEWAHMHFIILVILVYFNYI